MRRKSDSTVARLRRDCRATSMRRMDVAWKGKRKGSSLVIEPLTILDSGAFTTSEVTADWQ